MIISGPEEIPVDLRSFIKKMTAQLKRAKIGRFIRKSFAYGDYLVTISIIDDQDTSVVTPLHRPQMDYTLEEHEAEAPHIPEERIGGEEPKEEDLPQAKLPETEHEERPEEEEEQEPEVEGPYEEEVSPVAGPDEEEIPPVVAEAEEAPEIEEEYPSGSEEEGVQAEVGEAEAPEEEEYRSEESTRIPSEEAEEEDQILATTPDGETYTATIEDIIALEPELRDEILDLNTLIDDQTYDTVYESEAFFDHIRLQRYSWVMLFATCRMSTIPCVIGDRTSEPAKFIISSISKMKYIDGSSLRPIRISPIIANRVDRVLFGSALVPPIRTTTLSEGGYTEKMTPWADPNLKPLIRIEEAGDWFLEKYKDLNLKTYTANFYQDFYPGCSTYVHTFAGGVPYIVEYGNNVPTNYGRIRKIYDVQGLVFAYSGRYGFNAAINCSIIMNLLSRVGIMIGYDTWRVYFPERPSAFSYLDSYPEIAIVISKDRSRIYGLVREVFTLIGMYVQSVITQAPFTTTTSFDHYNYIYEPKTDVGWSYCYIGSPSGYSIPRARMVYKSGLAEVNLPYYTDDVGIPPIELQLPEYWDNEYEKTRNTIGPFLVETGYDTDLVEIGGEYISDKQIVKTYFTAAYASYPWSTVVDDVAVGFALYAKYRHLHDKERGGLLYTIETPEKLEIMIFRDGEIQLTFDHEKIEESPSWDMHPTSTPSQGPQRFFLFAVSYWNLFWEGPPAMKPFIDQVVTNAVLKFVIAVPSRNDIIGANIYGINHNGEYYLLGSCALDPFYDHAVCYIDPSSIGIGPFEVDNSGPVVLNPTYKINTETGLCLCAAKNPYYDWPDGSHQSVPSFWGSSISFGGYIYRSGFTIKFPFANTIEMTHDLGVSFRIPYKVAEMTQKGE